MSETVKKYGYDEDVHVTFDDEYGPVLVELFLSGSKAEREAMVGDIMQALGVDRAPSEKSGE